MKRLVCNLDVQMLLKDVSFSPNLIGLLGKHVSTEVVDISAMQSLILLGFIARLDFEKPDERAERPVFRYNLSVYVPIGTQPSRFIELLMEKIEMFARHEVREGVCLAGKKVSNPHDLDWLTSFREGGMSAKQVAAARYLKDKES